MAFVHRESQECTKSKLDLFSIATTQTSISKGQWIEYHRISNITDSGPIAFYVSGTGDGYLDLARTQLFVKAKITKVNGTALDADTQVGPVNLLTVHGHVLQRQCWKDGYGKPLRPRQRCKHGAKSSL